MSITLRRIRVRPLDLGREDATETSKPWAVQKWLSQLLGPLGAEKEAEGCLSERKGDTDGIGHEQVAVLDSHCVHRPEEAVDAVDRHRRKVDGRSRARAEDGTDA